MSISHLIETYGYWSVFLLVGIESVGIPVPGETALIVAGTYAGHTHRLSPWIIFAVASAGAIVGDTIGFWVGRKGGSRLAYKFGHRIGIDREKLEVGRYVFDAYGPKVVFFGRFVSILRAYVAFLAGTSRMQWRRFWPANAAGGIVWAGIFSAAGYLAGNALTHFSGTIDLVLGAGALLGFVTAMVVVRRQYAHLALRARAASLMPSSPHLAEAHKRIERMNRAGDRLESDSKGPLLVSPTGAPDHGHIVLSVAAKGEHSQAHEAGSVAFAKRHLQAKMTAVAVVVSLVGGTVGIQTIASHFSNDVARSTSLAGPTARSGHDGAADDGAGMAPSMTRRSRPPVVP